MEFFYLLLHAVTMASPIPQIEITQVHTRQEVSC